MLEIDRLNTAEPDFWARLETLTAWESVADEPMTVTAREIIVQVRARGDEALMSYTNRFDRRAITRAADLEIPAARRRQEFA